MSTQKPREFWIPFDKDSEYIVSMAYPSKEAYLQSCLRFNKEEIHVIEKSHADALELRVKELEEARESLNKYVERTEKEPDAALTANAELTRKLAKAVEQRNKLSAWYFGALVPPEHTAELDAELKAVK